ncbi:glycosyltransferase [Chryseobacterium sp. CH21]|uniref:glycosyltransferase n=1 Tax=Chryseobacterium sp. CH21 TaxID=713556 RepID=UPI001E4B94E1|nr:glycosyltransferase [Chryseobacterium sp. CH21]
MSISSLLEITYENEYTIPIINSVNGRPDYDYSDILWFRSEKEIYLLKESYRHLSAIQILFDSYKDFLPETFQGKTFVIPNPVPQFDESEIVNLTIEKEKYKIIHIGTLSTDCKQQHIAIEVFAEIVKEFPNWELHFWGVGNDFDFLNKKIKEYNLQTKIFLNGFTNNPISKLKEADIFIFPSKYEGFGLALAEAMSIGLPVLGFMNCSGVNELIKHNITGFLAQNTEELIFFLKKIMADPILRSKLGTNSHFEMNRFTHEKMLQEWRLLIEEYIS